MADWQVFQTDVLDVLRQYQGYFDFFERVGSLGDDSRPDCFARVTREDKKEVWILDAKNKPEIDEGDIGRMEKYMEMVRSNPVDVGLDLSELGEHEIRGVFITSSGEMNPEKFEQVKFSSLHQFLQRELVYTETDRVVRDVAKMMERKELSQSQARLLFKSIKPFEAHLSRAVNHLEELETEYVGLELDKPPIDTYEYNMPVDAVLKHKEREKVFLIDIPYSQRAVKEIEKKIDEIKRRLKDTDEEVYYAAINRFESRDQKHVYQLEELEDEIKTTAGIASPDNIAGLFTPKIPVEKEYFNNYIEIRDKTGVGYRLRVKSKDDISHSVEIKLPQDAVSRLKDSCINARKDLGNISGNTFRQDIRVTEDLEVEYSGRKEPLNSFKDTVRSIYQSAVNPELAKKTNKIY